MIKNLSYNDENSRDEINSLVGDAYTWYDNIKIGGGKSSPIFKVILASENINLIIEKTNINNLCIIELRPKGIIVSFNSIHANYVWAIPYYQLTIFKKNGYTSIYGGQEFIRIKNNHHNSINQKFIERLLEIRSSYLHHLSLLN